MLVILIRDDEDRDEKQETGTDDAQLDGIYRHGCTSSRC